MTWQNIFQVLENLFVLYVSDKAILDAGGVATSPPVQVGSEGGKPLYARVQLCTNNQFPGG